MINWKPITEIPTEHWEKNDAISPEYLVKCMGVDRYGNSIIGYTSYSFAVNKWISCFRNTEGDNREIIAWTDEKI